MTYWPFIRFNFIQNITFDLYVERSACHYWYQCLLTIQMMRNLKPDIKTLVSQNVSSVIEQVTKQTIWFALLNRIHKWIGADNRKVFVLKLRQILVVKIRSLSRFKSS
ncbi:hypothetical protein VIBNISFn27_130251 [Vibrio nigripulchritudo SFn27]|nr:hypothetical protein VIBNISFn27_130251 [Vibrio nigripulchritudo SFn27]CCN94767.1 hypothetical protein VIBNIENn2_430273 [Vibrio nigripulchritudo ENn2]